MGARESVIAKRTAKDSVFTDLFGIPKYLLQLYQALHPEDKETSLASTSFLQKYTTSRLKFMAGREKRYWKQSGYAKIKMF